MTCSAASEQVNELNKRNYGSGGCAAAGSGFPRTAATIDLGSLIVLNLRSH
jgi:hypothetical protein